MIAESRGVAAVIGAGSIMTILEPEDLEPWVEDTGIGYSEFFDWLAGTTNEELRLLYVGIFKAEPFLDVPTAADRYQIGLRVWDAM